jgi:hypothetical protein
MEAGGQAHALTLKRGLAVRRVLMRLRPPRMDTKDFELDPLAPRKHIRLVTTTSMPTATDLTISALRLGRRTVNTLR